MEYLYPILVWWAVISIISAIVTRIDKKRSKKKGASRIPEATMFLLAFLGGAEVMYITMRRIRHKTKHLTFMIGLPLIMILHIIAVIGVFCLM